VASADDILLSLTNLRLLRDGPHGETCVLDGLDLGLRRGERLAVVGGNGSGKSSLLRHLAVTAPVVTGMVFQDPDEQLVTATVSEEVALGRPYLDVGATLAEWGLAGREAHDPRVLSAGQKQRLQLAVVLGGRPELVLADEPSSLQDPQQAAWVRERLLRWRAETGGTLVWATQRPEEVAAADRVLVLRAGRVVALGVPDDVRQELTAVLSDEGLTAAATATRAEGTPVARWEGIGFRFPDGGGFANVTLTLRPGDRVGITGPNGCGKSTLLAATAGLRKPDLGAVRLGERLLYRRATLDLDHGLAALAPQFPEYLFTQTTVAREIAVDPDLAAADVLTRIGLPADLATRNPHDLSGGEKRRLALAFALLSHRPLVLLDEPTAALDAEGRRGVARLVRESRLEAVVVIASHDVIFLRACGCDVHNLTVTGLESFAHRG
jgi:energy-coupling factor transporter ATP-binding protein EcfA2